MSRRPPLVVLAVALLFLACSGPPKTAGQSGPAPESDPERDERRSSVVEFETFDASRYAARPPVEAVEILHQVPKRLMQGRAAEGITRTLEGFRIQVFSALDQQAAQDFQTRVRQWWESVKDDAPRPTFEKKPPIVLVYSQPYYRVRIGAFVDREVAERALQFVRKEYPKAFIARGTVTVTQ